MSVASRWTIPADHPRIRGEHVRRPLRQGERLGSSPHTRGAPTSCRSWHSPLRIIPAYAGSTKPPYRRRRSGGDHPRIRGEHTAWLGSTRSTGGSSPHTRGARMGFECDSMPSRIIPAYAGSTSCPHGAAATSSDHPRIRGEHASKRRSNCRNLGSSPHTRGAPSAAPVATFRTRIIPAYAGSTRVVPVPGPDPGDHPRIRGEHLVVGVHDEVSEGSSPHTRGALMLLILLASSCGIIPAYAGSTTLASARFHSLGDHPRIRGEHHRSMDGQA